MVYSKAPWFESLRRERRINVKDATGQDTGANMVALHLMEGCHAI